MRTLAGGLQSLVEHGYAFNLDVEAQELRTDRRPRRPRLSKITPVDFIHLLEAFGRQTRQIDSATNDVGKRGTSRGENVLDISKTSSVCRARLPVSILPVAGSYEVIPETKRNFPLAATASE